MDAGNQGQYRSIAGAMGNSNRDRAAFVHALGNHDEPRDLLSPGHSDLSHREVGCADTERQSVEQ